MSRWTPADNNARRAVYRTVRREEPDCWLCGQPIDQELEYPHPYSFSVDHVIPASRAPELALDRMNLRAAHLHCNRVRGARMLTELPSNVSRETHTSRAW